MLDQKLKNIAANLRVSARVNGLSPNGCARLAVALDAHAKTAGMLLNAPVPAALKIADLSERARAAAAPGPAAPYGDDAA